MKILLVSQYFHPEQFRVNDIAQAWAERGHEVTVVTGVPNYPAGRFFSGYGWFRRRREKWNGVRVLRLPITPRGKGALPLAMNYLSFVVSGFFWQAFTRERPDIVFVYEVSPMTQALLGVWLAKRRKIPCFLYVLDLWPENVEMLSGIKSKAALGLIGRVVDRVYRGCDRVFTATRSASAAIAARGVPAEKLAVWPQYAEEFYRPAPPGGPEELADSVWFTAIFAGNVGEAQGLDVLPRAAAILKAQGARVRFAVVGDGRYKETLVRNVREAGLDEHFRFYSAQPAAAIPAWMASCGAALVALAKNRVFETTLPAKVPSCMACGVPILGCADGETKEVIERSGAGMCAPAGNAEALADAASAMSRMTDEDRAAMGARARAYYMANHEKNALLDHMEIQMSARVGRITRKGGERA